MNSRTTHLAKGFCLPILRNLKVTVLWRPKDRRYMAPTY